MSSDQNLLDAYRKQCRTTRDPWAMLLLWKMSREVKRGEVEMDDLIDISKEIAQEIS